MKKLLFWVLFLFVGIPAFALLAPLIPKSDYVWVGGLMIGLAFVFWLSISKHIGVLPVNHIRLDKARHEGYQQGRNEAMRR